MKPGLCLFFFIFIMTIITAPLQAEEKSELLETLGPLKVGVVMGTILGYDLNDQLIDLDQYRQKKGASSLLIAFFAPWCLPCLEELSLLKQQLPQLQQHRIEVVLMSLPMNKEGAPERQAKAKTRAFLEQHGISFFTVIDRNCLLAKNRFGVLQSSLPKAFLIGGDGKLKAIVNKARGDLIERLVEMAGK